MPLTTDSIENTIKSSFEEDTDDQPSATMAWTDKKEHMFIVSSLKQNQRVKAVGSGQD